MISTPNIRTSLVRILFDFSLFINFSTSETLFSSSANLIKSLALLIHFQLNSFFSFYFYNNKVIQKKKEKKVLPTSDPTIFRPDHLPHLTHLPTPPLFLPPTPFPLPPSHNLLPPPLPHRTLYPPSTNSLPSTYTVRGQGQALLALGSALARP